MEQQSFQLPIGLRLMETQVAGHTFQTHTDALGLLQDKEKGCVYKPLGKPECGERELRFYETLLHSEEPSVLAQAKMLVPRYHHKLKLSVNQKDYVFLKLEDLTCDVAKPCIIDIKIGKRTWDPMATPQKRNVEERKYARCKGSLGLCLPGFQMYSLADSGAKILRHGKEYGKQLDADGFRATIALFLNAQTSVCKPLVREILKQLYDIYNWFNTQTLFHFYASSLLIVYDFEQLQAQLAGPEQNCQTIVTNGNAQDEQMPAAFAGVPPREPKDWVKIRMIDFAHVFPADSGTLDTNYLFGLQHLIAIVEQLLER